MFAWSYQIIDRLKIKKLFFQVKHKQDSYNFFILTAHEQNHLRTDRNLGGGNSVVTSSMLVWLLLFCGWFMFGPSSVRSFSGFQMRERK